jgi:hypothetical protein
VELLPCPKCCQGDDLAFVQVCSGSGYGVLCRRCHLTVDSRAATEAEAATVWNARAPSAPSDDGIVVARKALSEFTGLRYDEFEEVWPEIFDEVEGELATERLVEATGFGLGRIKED